jgi:hypothetical protein
MLPLLDIALTRTTYISYYHPSHKISAIEALLYRAFVISDPEFLQEELNHVMTQFLQNNYPKTLIESRIQRMKDKSSQNKPR